MSCPKQSDILSNSLNTLAKNLHATSSEKGFWPEDEKNFRTELSGIIYSKIPDSFQSELLCDQIFELAKKHRAWNKEMMIAQKLLLAVGEIGEAIEGLRKGNPPDDHIPSLPSFQTEIADTIIRLLDLCHELKIDIGDTISKKHEYNKQREKLHGKKF